MAGEAASLSPPPPIPAAAGAGERAWGGGGGGAPPPPASPTQWGGEPRTEIGLWAGGGAGRGATPPGGKRGRFSTAPPYSSVRRFIAGVRKEESKYPWP